MRKLIKFLRMAQAYRTELEIVSGVLCSVGTVDKSKKDKVDIVNKLIDCIIDSLEFKDTSVSLPLNSNCNVLRQEDLALLEVGSLGYLNMTQEQFDCFKSVILEIYERCVFD